MKSIYWSYIPACLRAIPPSPYSEWMGIKHIIFFLFTIIFFMVYSAQGGAYNWHPPHGVFMLNVVADQPSTA